MARNMAARPVSVDRRAFLRGAGIAGLAVGAPGFLAACGTSGSKQSAKSCVSKDLSATEKSLNFSNWPEYIDVTKNGKKIPSLEKFMTQTGIKVTYNTDINDNDEFFAKVSNQLGDCQPIGRDIITMTDWMAARMINLGWIQKLDHAKIPNVDANLISSLKSPGWDPKRDYTVPWQSGLTGIAYNAKYTGEVKSVEGADHPLGPQGQGQHAHRDAGHDGLHAQDRGRGPGRLQRRTTGTTPSTSSRRPSLPDRSAGSPATTTSTTSMPATWSPARRGPATSSRCSSTTPTSSGSCRRRAWPSGRTT